MEKYTNWLLLIIVVLIAIIVISKLGCVSIKKKKIKMELEHLSDVYRITAEELQELKDSEKPNEGAIFSQSSYLNILIGRIQGYCYLLDYTYVFEYCNVIILDKKKKNEVLE